MKAIETLKNAIGLENKAHYTEEDFFDALESAYLYLYDDCKGYSPEDAAALGDAAENGGTLKELEYNLQCLIEEFILWCEDEVEDGGNVGIQACGDDVDHRAWWVAPLFHRYAAMVSEFA